MSASSGSHNLQVRAIDAAGNAADCAAAVTVPAPGGTTKPVWRFHNKKNGAHFYTASESEKSAVTTNLSATYTYDGAAYNVAATTATGTVPVYRFYNKKNGSHFYTAAESEKDDVIARLTSTYRYDGVAYNVFPVAGVRNISCLPLLQRGERFTLLHRVGV